MTSNRCDICRGARTIKLPVYRSTTVAFTEAMGCPHRIDASSREFPCPECGESAPLERISALTEVSEFASDIKDPTYMQHVQRSMARALSEQLIEAGLIAFKVGPADKYTLRTSIKATIGAVSPRVVASLEQRIAERQMDVARKVALRAGAIINSWGAAYGDEGLPKTVATRALSEAMEAIKLESAA